MDALIFAALALMMLVLGVSLPVGEIVKIAMKPKIVVVTFGFQLIMLPLVAFVACVALPLSAEIKVGIMILSVCPGGVTSSFVTHFVGADLSTSVFLTTTSGILASIYVPVLIDVSIWYFLGRTVHVELPFWETVGQVLSITLVPVSIGVGLRLLLKNSLRTFERIARWISSGLLLLVFMLKLFGKSADNVPNISLREIFELLPVLLVLGVAWMSLTYLFLFLFTDNKAQKVACLVEAGLRNTTLSFLVCGTILRNPVMMKPALVYALFSFWTTLIFAYLLMKNRQPA